MKNLLFIKLTGMQSVTLTLNAYKIMLIANIFNFKNSKNTCGGFKNIELNSVTKKSLK